MSKITRRSALKTLLAGTAVTATGLPVRLSFAAGMGDKRLILVIQRGGMDGLAAVPPYGDPAYASARGGLALPKPGASGGVLNLDGFYGLHPAFQPLLPIWQANELAVFQAIGLKGYDGRSHFDAQNLVETAAVTPRSRDTGWLNRSLAQVSGSRPCALAVGESVPLVLLGKEPVTSWAPAILPEADEDYLNRVAGLYARDPALAAALKSALDIRKVASGADMGDDTAGGQGQQRRSFANLVKGAMAILKAPGSPRIAVLDIGGWDTHAQQGLIDDGRLQVAMKELASGLEAMKTELAPIWDDTAILVVTEFGRTVAENGSRGTDHGTGTTAFLIGGGVRGGKVYADWPGLSSGSLNDGRDLKITTPLYGLYKSVLMDHLKLPHRFIDTEVLDTAASVAPVPDLFRA